MGQAATVARARVELCEPEDDRCVRECCHTPGETPVEVVIEPRKAGLRHAEMSHSQAMELFRIHGAFADSYRSLEPAPPVRPVLRQMPWAASDGSRSDSEAGLHFALPRPSKSRLAGARRAGSVPERSAESPEPRESCAEEGHPRRPGPVVGGIFPKQPSQRRHAADATEPFESCEAHPISRAFPGLPGSSPCPLAPTETRPGRISGAGKKAPPHNFVLKVYRMPRGGPRDPEPRGRRKSPSPAAPGMRDRRSSPSSPSPTRERPSLSCRTVDSESNTSV